MVPGALTRLSPSRCASPDRGWTKPAYPSGIATATPVPTRARWNGASSTSSATVRSAPASPGSAYRGGAPPGEVSWTGTSSWGGTSGGGTSGTAATLAAPRRVAGPAGPGAGSQLGADPVGQQLGGAAVGAARDPGAGKEGRGGGDGPGEPSRDAPAQLLQPGAAQDRDDARAGVDGSPARPRGEVGGGPLAGIAGGPPAVELVQLADQHHLDGGGDDRLGTQRDRQGDEGRGREPLRGRQSAGARADGGGDPRRPGDQGVGDLLVGRSGVGRAEPLGVAD